MGLFELKKPDVQEKNLPKHKNTSLERKHTADPKRKKGDFENVLENRSAAKLIQFEQLQTAKVAIIEQHLTPPKPGESILVWTTNQFNTMAFILWIIKHFGVIESLTISTYSIGATSINTIMRWFDSKQIKEIYFYVASYAKKINAKNTAHLEAQARSRHDITVSYGFNHSKVLLAKTASAYITISGSGNFSENAYNEQYTICNDEKIYKFYYSNIRADNT